LVHGKRPSDAEQSLHGLRVRRNYPYRNSADGFTTYLRRRFDAAR
jgi:hypothetical protein